MIFPSLARAKEVVLDFETTSHSKDLDSLNPWHHCWIAGVCICADGEAYYIPVDHQNPTPNEPNHDREEVIAWLREIVEQCEVLVGHNIKYDLHIMANDFGIHVPPRVQLWDTLTQAKLYDSERMSFSLKDLSKDWLDEDIDGVENALRPYLFDHKGRRFNKDYGLIPSSIMAPYGKQDVIATRGLKEYLEQRVTGIVSENEIKLTRILYDLERVGMKITPVKVLKKQLVTKCRLIEIIQRIRDVSGVEIRPNTTDDCYRFLIGQYGLPIFEWSDEGDPSFNKKAMNQYAAHPRVQQDPVLSECVALIQEFRVLHTFDTLFLENFKEKHIDGTLHPSYNQCVRTGRLSCSSPNAQQMSSLAKELIEVPDESWVLVDIDLSQIEFRLVAHTLQNPGVLKAYRDDPNADYHQIVADMAGLDRKPAKNLNFACAFGAGKKKTIEMVKLSLNVESEDYLKSGMEFEKYCEVRANQLYTEYFLMLPELRDVSKKATAIAKNHGFISNLYGRKRHLRGKFSYKAFNAAIQSGAADIAKDITIQIAKITDEKCVLIGVVHDSWIFYMKKDCYTLYCDRISSIIEAVSPPQELRVPILCDVAISETNWKECEKI